MDENASTNIDNSAEIAKLNAEVLESQYQNIHKVKITKTDYV